MTEEEAKARAIAWMAEPWDGGPFEDALAALLLSVAAEQRERDAVVCEEYADNAETAGFSSLAAAIRGES